MELKEMRTIARDKLDRNTTRMIGEQERRYT